ncbi:Holliday junction branch migration protein RuvA [Candidatus Dojkabacteria bacterium]|uniref:Holliday junction branch migration complex subunit RuvA n=1 Tax=Candidatus Dojkabacteria bacterium TaxID=2099670 RepID=A0A847VDJ0_9BACT|nr:Holliday junction branch migration protein RuvA [Candidatus Dojkabacteria bacterium]
MISYISGKILKYRSTGKVNYIDILLSSGIGYRVFVTSQFSINTKQSEIALYTSFQVKEDSNSLYGFNTEEERDFFEELLNVSGIGPKLALSILSTYSMNRVKEIVLKGDAKLLSECPGLGIKGAQKVILELRGRIDFEQEKESGVDIKIKELKEVLRTLGFKGEELKDAVDRGKSLLKKDDMDIEILIKKVLQN